MGMLGFVIFAPWLSLVVSIVPDFKRSLLATGEPAVEASVLAVGEVTLSVAFMEGAKAVESRVESPGEAGIPFGKSVAVVLLLAALLKLGAAALLANVALFASDELAITASLLGTDKVPCQPSSALAVAFVAAAPARFSGAEAFCVEFTVPSAPTGSEVSFVPAPGMSGDAFIVASVPPAEAVVAFAAPVD